MIPVEYTRFITGSIPTSFVLQLPLSESTPGELLGLAPDRPLVAFIGALGHDRRKGFDILFDAWCQCRDHGGWDASLVVAGTGSELAFWKRRVLETGQGNDICFLGFTKAIPTVLAAADALVSPARFELYGQGVHEAVCCGLTVFVTCCAGISERFPVDYDDMLLDDPPDAAQLCRRLRDWHKDIDGYRRKMLPFAVRIAAGARGRTWRPSSWKR